MSENITTISRLKRRLILLLCGATVTLVCATAAVAMYGAYRTEAARARDELRSIARNYVLEVSRKFQFHVDIISSLAEIMAGYRDIDVDVRRRIFDLELHAMIAAQPGIIDIFTAWKPGVIDELSKSFANMPGSDETGNYITLFSRESGTIKRRAYANWQYALAHVQREILFSRPSPRTVMGESINVISIFSPIFEPSHKHVIGIVGITLNVDFLQTLIANLHPYASGKASLFAYDGVSVADANEALVGEEVLEYLPQRDTPVLGTNHENFVIVAPFRIGDSTRLWTLRLTVPKLAVLQTAIRFTLQILAIAGAVIFISSLIIYRQVSKTFNAFEQSEQKRISAESAGEQIKNEFFTKISHELRTPLNAVLGLTQIMRVDNLDNVQANYLKDITKMTGWLLMLINDVLDFVKVETGTISINEVSYNLYTLIDRVSVIMKPRADQKGLHFSVECAADLPKVVLGDEMRVRQIISKVLENAIKYTERGAVKISVRSAFLPGNSQAYWAAQIDDTGRGIKKEDLPKIFNAGTQLEYRKNRGVSGIGMGLVLARKLLDMMNGKITVESAVDCGSTFVVYFPLRLGDAENLVENSVSAWWVVSGGAVRILVVDDTEVNLTVAAGFLAEHNITADTAESGEEALSKCESKTYDLILMDHMMPEMDGCEATRRLRARSGVWQTLPIISFSANVTAAARQLFSEAGMNDFMAKPLDDETLNALLLRYLPPEKIDLLDMRVQCQAAEPDNMILRMDLSFTDEIDIEQGVFNVGGDWKKYRGALKEAVIKIEAAVVEIKANLADENYKSAGKQLRALLEILSQTGVTQNALDMELSARILTDNTANGQTEFIDCLTRLEKLATELRGTSLFE